MKCENCIYYHTYYRRGYFNFWGDFEGTCDKFNKTVFRNDTCNFVKGIPKQIATVTDVDYAIQALKQIIDIYR